MFSKACEYGIRATIFIAEQSMQNRRVNLKEIAVNVNSPVAFTAKILQQLTHNGIIVSVKGAAGGFDIPEQLMRTTPLSQIVSAIDGDSIYNGCGLGLRECSKTKPCPLHGKFSKIREELKNMLEETTVYELSSGTKAGLTYLKN